MVGDEAESTEDAPAVAPAGTARPRRKWRAAVVVVLLIAVAVAGYLWLTQARVLKGLGDQSSGPVAPGHTFYTDSGIYPASGKAITVDFRDIRPRVTLNTADASIDLLTCTTAPGSNRIGAVLDDIDTYCAPAAPWRSGTVSIGFDADTYIILAITPHRDGKVTIDGEDVRYRHGIRFGAQNAGAFIVVTTP